ncbi:hypothetical protein FKW77_001188 [Venturia effusa]|uniref:Uncharacterized protein n=1 Tax=Venturia effusa TaxID=50376 RepID=A0A517LPH9_9PEZI|nr:hypothetical protein FKW77_001188 [Venturia effusa]
MSVPGNMYEVLHEEEEDEGVKISGGAERTASPKKLSFGEKIVHERRKSSSAIRRIGDLKSSTASRPLSMVSSVRTADPAGDENRVPGPDSLSQFLADASRRKSLPALLVKDRQDHHSGLATSANEDSQNRRQSIPYRPVDESQDRGMSVRSSTIDESRIYNRGVRIEAKICKVHFSAWRRNLHRGCDDKDCPLHHDPRGWPARVVNMISSGPMKELLEIQRDIDVVLGKGEFDVDAVLTLLKPSIATPPRGRERRDEKKVVMADNEELIPELTPEELAVKGRRIQEIWDEALRLYRLRKENPDAVVATRKRSQVEDRSQALSFF